MLKLDNNLLEELGLGGLPEDQKRQMLQHIYETLELRVGTQLANQMTDKQLEEFEKFIDAGGDTNQAQALQWLETNLPNYKQVVQQTFESLKTEVRGMAPQLLAAAQQAQGPQEAQVVSQPAPQGIPMPAQPVMQQDAPAPSQFSNVAPQQTYGQSFQAPQPTYGTTQQSSYGATPAPVAPQDISSAATPVPMQPLNNDLPQTPPSWQTPVVPVSQPEPTAAPLFPSPPPVSDPVNPSFTPMSQQPADPFAAQAQPLQPTVPSAAPSFDQPMAPQVPTQTWNQPPTQAQPAPAPSAPQSWQPQSPTPAPTWQPQPPTDQQPPQAA